MESIIAAGDSSPFSRFVESSEIPREWLFRRASPTSVTNIEVLPLAHGKKGIKSFLRHKLFSPNHDIRSVLYKSLSKRIDHNAFMFSEAMYNDFVVESFPKVENPVDVPLPSFVHSGDDIPFYMLNADGQFELKRILLCIEHHFPHIVHCPILPPIISLFLHYDDSPSQVFLHSCHLIFSNVCSIHYIDQSETEAEISTDILKMFVKKFAATSHKALLNFTDNPDHVYNQWLKVLFHGLPFSYVVVLFDMYLVDGYKALFRVAIAVLKFYKRMGSSNPQNILQAVHEFVYDIDTKVSAYLLFRKAYRIKLPPTKEIRKLYQKRLISEHYVPSALKGIKSDSKSSWRYIYLVRNVPSNIINEELFSKLYCWLPPRITTLRPTKIFSTERSGYNLATLFQASDDRSPTLLLIKTTSDFIIGAYLSSDWSERSSKSFFGTGETFVFSLSPETKKYGWNESEDGGMKDASTSHDIGTESIASSQVSEMRWLTPGATRTSHGTTFPHIRINSGATSVSSSNKESKENFVLPPIVGSPVFQESSPSPSWLNATDSKCSVKVRQYSSIEGKRHKSNASMFMYADDTGLAIGGGNGYGIFLDCTFLNCTTSACDTFSNEPLVPEGKFVCACVEVFGFTD